VRALAEVAMRGDEVSFDAVVVRTRHESGEVRISALEALVHISKPGDRHALAVVTACLKDPQGRVRRAAMTILEQLRNAS